MHNACELEDKGWQICRQNQCNYW